MATEAEVLETVIEPMAAIFGRPYGCQTGQEVEMAQAEYLKTLRGYPIDALEKGWADIRAEWTKRTWPPIAEIVNAARRHIQRKAPDPRDDMRMTPLQARQALNTTPEGDLAYCMRIPASFVNFATREGRIPSENELRQIAAARFNEEELEQIVSRVESGYWQRALRNLGLAIIQRNEQMCGERENT